VTVRSIERRVSPVLGQEEGTKTSERREDQEVDEDQFK
jgi:hypothetical protein